MTTPPTNEDLADCVFCVVQDLLGYHSQMKAHPCDDGVQVVSDAGETRLIPRDALLGAMSSPLGFVYLVKSHLPSE